MPNRLLLDLSERASVRDFVSRHRLTSAVVNRFVAGESIDDAIRAATGLKQSGVEVILDYLGENVITEVQADSAATTYFEILDRLAREDPPAHISVKLTQLGLDLSPEGCIERMEKLCVKAGEVATNVEIDMESQQYVDRTIEVYRRLRDSYDNLVLCLQAYLRRTHDDIEKLLPLSPRIRLCKGAYNEPREISHGRRRAREAYRRLLGVLLRNASLTAVATHDQFLIDEALRMSKAYSVPPERYEFQMLFGIRRDLQMELATSGMPVRIYVPFGDQWYPYLMRRLAERPANLRFFMEALIRG